MGLYPDDPELDNLHQQWEAAQVARTETQAATRAFDESLTNGNRVLDEVAAKEGNNLRRLEKEASDHYDRLCELYYPARDRHLLLEERERRQRDS